MYTGHDYKKKNSADLTMFLCVICQHIMHFHLQVPVFFLNLLTQVNALNTYTRIINFLKLHCFGTIKTKTTLFVI